ncbi:hypothetical protein Lesp02_61180 [Lentzea sp. NBRC 105346]|uniref:hypothetical protein n=1 Tax=Lentzea sp. NBRC 105346 TaxID=3032205 RepID=UPI0025524DF5|nr:hypothetical protein [Lentzea sp. NBRC 105346]GLZ33930.1 hypothetical protein Lesp02_61180 [Lentzea sp. NBRC 105346]
MTDLLPDLCERVHRGGPAVTALNPLELLWTRKAIAGSPLARHVALVTGGGPEPTGWRYDPQAARAELRDNPAGLGPEFEPWNRACGEMVEHACALLDEISQVRLGGDGPGLWHTPVEVGDDSAGAILAQARAGANRGRTTKSNPWVCTSPHWAAVLDELGMAGVAWFPTVALGSWWMSHLTRDYTDWREDYISVLSYTFYFEYNLDSAEFGRSRAERMLHDLNRLWDVPDLPSDLRARRLHMAASMAFFDAKRKHEGAVRTRPTDGLTAWVHRDRDRWRDFKAQDSGAWGHYLSFPSGEEGRDDMMLTGLTNDWVDLGPDLRNDECNQSVLALTRGSLTTSALLQCYERTVWMMNAQLTPSADVKPDRYAACLGTIGTCMWEMSNHRHDLWRYYLIGLSSCAEAVSRNLYRACQLADCYTPDLQPCSPVRVSSITVPRRALLYDVVVADERHIGEVLLHNAVCSAVESGLLPMSVVTYAYVVPMLVRTGKITFAGFLTYMDSVYCSNFALVMRAGHACSFSEPFGRGIAALVFEQWWCGMYFAIGLGSLIEAQPGNVANDRAH